MLAEKITSTRLALAGLAGNIPEDAWLLVRNAQAQLASAADIAERLENSLLVPNMPPRILHPVRQQPERYTATSSATKVPHLRLITINKK